MERNEKPVGRIPVSCSIFLILFASCAMPTISRFAEDNQDVTEEFRASTSVSLSWIYDGSTPIDSFNLYYRVHGTSSWSLLDTLSSAAPYFEVTHDSIGDGKWDFGVTAVDSQGDESDVHSSLDSTADPTTGWYLLWKE